MEKNPGFHYVYIPCDGSKIEERFFEGECQLESDGFQEEIKSHFARFVYAVNWWSGDSSTRTHLWNPYSKLISKCEKNLNKPNPCKPIELCILQDCFDCINNDDFK